MDHTAKMTNFTSNSFRIKSASVKTIRGFGTHTLLEQEVVHP